MSTQTPIIPSLLDLDLYKLTMNQLQWRKHRDEPAVFRLNNRTKTVQLLDFVSIDDVRAETDAVRALRVTDAEATYLKTLDFDVDYIDWLQRLQLPELLIGADGQVLTVEAHGTWAEISLWETLVLAIVNELFCRGYIAQNGLDIEALKAEGQARLDKKIEILTAHPDIAIIEFGTRRRFSEPWQEYVIAQLHERIGDSLTGTSNVYQAMKRGLTPIGTYAHEMPMAYTGIYNDLQTQVARGHRQMMDDWFEEFGVTRSVALTDTFGSEFFFDDFKDIAADWTGLRHDSGDPFDFGERVIDYYTSLNIDPTQKLIVFSDGLDIDVIVKLHERFDGRIKVSFGWGTNLTNDLGIPTLSLVMKLVGISGRGTVKLSDNVNKAMGDQRDIDAAVKLFTYTNTDAAELVV